jgi:DNA primase
MAYQNSVVQDVKDRLNISDVVGSYIQIKKAGTNYKANCPFHSEKTSSFMVSPSKQIWHCFGCGEGGDVFGFVMKFENVDFNQAIKILADRAGVQLPKFSPQHQQQEDYKERLLAANELAARYYYEVLRKSSLAKDARDYLSNRKLQAETVKDWLIGYAPGDFHSLENFLFKKGFNSKELIDAGLSSKSERGTYDRFFDRVTFPIRNYTGDVVGFTARILKDDKKAAKYVNSPETLVYSKGRVIFGLYQAKQAIRKSDSAIIVEGNMDVISAHQAGFQNVVASSGTAFTVEQLQVLARLTKNLKFAFDTDAAGVLAARRTLDLALQQGFNVYIVKIEGAKDPDELIKKNPQAFTKAALDAPLYIDFFFEKSFENYEPSSVQSKKKVVNDLVPLLRNLTDQVELSHYVNILAQRLGTDEKTVYGLMARNRSETAPEKRVNNSKDKVVSEAVPETLVKTRSYQLEQRIIGYTLFDPVLRSEITTDVEPDEFREEPFRKIYTFVLQSHKQSPEADPTEALYKALPHFSEVAKVAAFMIESEYNQAESREGFRANFMAILREFKNITTKARMRVLVSEMVLAEQKKDKESLAILNKKFLELSQHLKKFGN